MNKLEEHLTDFENEFSTWSSLSFKKRELFGQLIYTSLRTSELFYAYCLGVSNEADACWNAIQEHVTIGGLSGDGGDKTAERNGLILASNTIMGRIKK